MFWGLRSVVEGLRFLQGSMVFRCLSAFFGRYLSVVWASGVRHIWLLGNGGWSTGCLQTKSPSPKAF